MSLGLRLGRDLQPAVGGRVEAANWLLGCRLGSFGFRVLPGIPGVFLLVLLVLVGIRRDSSVRVGVRVRDKDRCRFIGHARTPALQAAATLDVHALRQAKGKQAAIGGKKHLAVVVRMLVAWERSLGEE